MKQVKANYKTRIEDLKEPGDFFYGEWSDVIRLLAYICPCGKECHSNSENNCAIRITEDEKIAKSDNHLWLWDRNLASPTLTPSIRDNGCKWHGYLTKGIWTGDIENGG